LDRVGLWCGIEALRDADWYDRRHAARIGLVLGTASEWLCDWEADGQQGGKRIYQSHREATTVAQRLRRRLELSGPAVSLSAACASGNYAFALARRWLQLGWVDVCLAGACDLAVTPLLLAGFGNLRALSRRNDDPVGASRPFDRDRDGFVMGEGAALFVLESAASARRRSARAHACLP